MIVTIGVSLISLIAIWGIIDCIKVELNYKRELREISAIFGNKLTEPKSEKRKKGFNLKKKQDNAVNPNLTPEMKEYFEAKECEDIETMKKCLIANAENCPNRNSYCLTEVFCPDCPLSKGALVVRR